MTMASQVAGLTPNKQRVAVYARYSTDRQDAASIDDQLRRCHQYAAARQMEVVAEYTDAAQSGAHLDRAGMQRLLTETKRPGGSPFAVVLVDDLSRLSRDMGNTWRLVFEDLAAVSVTVVDASTGMASDGQGARLTFGVKALVNDAFLETVRSQTHRGLEGRAINGFSTGGRVYGYRTEEEQTPQDPEHPRHLWQVFPDEAQVLRRIFAMYASGTGFKAIAHVLNGQGIPAPYDATRSKSRGRGWSSGTIRAILLNERYVGRFTWNKRRWLRNPGRKGRKSLPRPQSEWRTSIQPRLAIIDDNLWMQVQARFKERKKRQPSGRPVGTGQIAYLVSGILQCGECGARMGIIGTKKKAGHRYATYGCSAHYTKGPNICANSITVSERKASQAIVGALRDALLEAGLLERIVARFNQSARLLKTKTNDDSQELGRAIAAAQLRIRHLTDAVAEGQWSASLRARLHEEESRLSELQEQRKALSVVGSSRISLDPEKVEKLVRDLLNTLDTDPRTGQQFLAKSVGQMKLTPKEDSSGRYYEATGTCNLSAIIPLDQQVLRNPSCGGWI